MSTATRVAPTWVSLQTASDILGLSAAALRKTLERRAKRTADGALEAELDGVRGRKLGRLWRVMLSSAWTAVADGVVSAGSQSVRDDRERSRS